MNKEYLRLPGPVDPHVHLREPGATHKEDLETGTKAAAAGGYTGILDMPNNPEPTITPEALNKKINLATGRIYVDVGFNYGATLESSRTFEQIQGFVRALKVYMNPTTGNLLVEKDEDLELIFLRWPHGKPIMVHAEGETFARAIDLARKTRQRMHLCHMSLASEVELVKQAKNEGLPVTCEVSVHHLFLNEDDADDIPRGFGRMKPPLATEDDRLSLWRNLDVIDVLASDHAPHTKGEKDLFEEGRGPYGVPGLETSLPIMLTAVMNGRLSIEKLVDMVSTKPKQIFGIRDNNATYIEVDLGYKYTIDESRLQTKAGWTPFSGVPVEARIARVVLRGQEVFNGEEIVGPPRGKII